ncbi:hypothetical protein EV643_105311 [Kribbella sp. VKM Ac-2527]|uniref:Uncharacterized protein n=1 Tax=Kribbella caucasensis TaxID=2512215 RepID=A0A4R6KGS0_9ACTN|nr:hypothetical protein [Kribbella sp. VKM Ac-2527]TDO50080.1 hypothetical protein EV643_105311 [Kribbella sp. VKM Ac-2527]
MSNQQPPYGPGGQPPYQGQPPQQAPYQGQPQQGQPSYQGQPQQGQPGYGRPPQQPPYQGQPPQQPPYQGQPPQQPPYQGQPQQGQPPYQGQPQQPQYQQGQQYPGQQQPGYPTQQQTFPGQQQYPGQQPPPWGPQGQQQFDRQRGKGNNKILLLAGGALAVVVVIGIVLALIFGRGDDNNVEPNPTPTSEPTGQPTADVDEGIEVAEGVYVKPAAGYIRKTMDKFTGVFLLKQGEAYFMVNAIKAEGQNTQTVLPQLLEIEKKATPGGFKAKEPRELKPGADDKTEVKLVTTQAFEATATSQSGSFPVIGFVGVIERNDGVITIIRVFGRKDKASTIQPDSTAMMKSVIASQ